MRAAFYYALVVLFLIFEIALSVSPSVMVSQLMTHFSVTALGLSVLSSAYYYSYMGMQIPGGLLIDRLGVRTVMIASLLICSLGLVMFSMTLSLATAIIARFMMGAGGASAFVLLLTVARTQFPTRWFACLSGGALLAAGIGAIFGQTVLAWGLKHIDWHHALSLLASLGFGLALASVFWLQGLHAPRTSSANRMAPKLTTVFALLKTPQMRWIALFALLNVIPLAIFADLWGIAYFQTAYHMDVKPASVFITMIWLGFGLTSPFLGYLSDKMQRRKPLLYGISILNLLALWGLMHTTWFSMPVMLTLMFLLGVGTSGQSLCFALIKDHFPASIFATASAINNMAIVITPVIFQPLVGWLLKQHAHGTTHHYTLADYHYAFVLLPITGLIALGISLFRIQETHCKTQNSLAVCTELTEAPHTITIG